MKVLKDLGLLYLPGVRGLMYLEAFVQNGLVPGVILIQGDPGGDPLDGRPDSFREKYRDYFDPEKTLDHYINTYGIDTVSLKHRDVNSPELRAEMRDRPENYFIFSGGGIIKPPLLSTGRRLIHIHPGILPTYRGSTCYYYSMLKEGNAGASAFFMEAGLDSGETIAMKSFEVPQVEERDWYFYDLLYDPWIRAEVLRDILGEYVDKGGFSSKPQNPSVGELYFIIHPVLKNIAIERHVRGK